MPFNHLRTLVHPLHRCPRASSSQSTRLAHTAASPGTDNEEVPSSSPHPRASSRPTADDGRSRSTRHHEYKFPERGANGGPPDPFEVLGVPRSASQGEIKTQYYKLALILHPDSSHPSASQEHFSTLSKAYNLVTSPKARRTYEDFGQGWSDAETFSPSYRPNDWMRAEVLRRARAGAGRRPSTMSQGAGGYGGWESRNSDSSRGAWGAFGVDGKWYDFPEAGVGARHGTGEPKFIMNPHSFMSLVILASCILGWVQYHRLDMVTESHRESLNAMHDGASHALATARQEARLHGQERRENIRRKVNEQKVVRELERLEAQKALKQPVPAIAAPPFKAQD